MKQKTMFFTFMLTFSACALFAKSPAENLVTNNTLKTDTIPTDSIPKNDSIPKTDTVSLRNMNTPLLKNSLNVDASQRYFMKEETAFAILPANKRSAK
jgi:hypothetical protein